MLEDFIEQMKVDEYYFIITVNTENLGGVLRYLIGKGAANILVEKPAGIDAADIEKTIKLLEGKNIFPYVAYNRRFYKSFLTAKKMIDEQGGLLSCHFEFTEWAHEIEKLDKTKEALENWLLGNSSHVIDIAFSIAGQPKEMSCYTSGFLAWHPRAAQFSGAGITGRDVVFSYQANWQSAGRWGVEFNTLEGKLILRPMEKLSFQKKGQLGVVEIDLNNPEDLDFKPGLYKQVEAFLNHENDNMISLQQHHKNVVNVLEKINGKVK
ncbi:MAG: gfo/Idh/MocA family oxidoreductase [Bacteroidia bacterium]|nr:gfo/Idh/MocA family oxidoreductase [Bacteroidia bacterium]